MILRMRTVKSMSRGAGSGGAPPSCPSPVPPAPRDLVKESEGEPFAGRRRWRCLEAPTES